MNLRSAVSRPVCWSENEAFFDLHRSSDQTTDICGWTRGSVGARAAGTAGATGNDRDRRGIWIAGPLLPLTFVVIQREMRPRCDAGISPTHK